VRDLVRTLAGAPVPGPSDETVRARVRAFGRADAVGHASPAALLLAAAWADARARGGGLLRAGPEGFAQWTFLAFAALFLLNWAAIGAARRRALAGPPAELARYYAAELRRRLAAYADRTDDAVLAVAGTLFLAAAGAAAVVLRGTFDSVPWLVEAALVFAWLVVLPWRARRTRLPRLERERDDFVAAGGALPGAP
jgi:hypothetical protein